MTLFILTLLLPLVFVSSRIYEVKLSVDDNHEWVTLNNASVYFILITQRGDIYTETPAYIIEDGLPDSKTYTYSLLLDDIGEPHSLRLIHTNANILCIDWISVNDQSVTGTREQRTHDCTSKEVYECQQITAYFNTQTIRHVNGTNEAYGCNWNAVMQDGLLNEYNIEITLDTSHDLIFYNNIGLLLEGFTFNNYYSPYYNLSNTGIMINDFWSYDKIELNIISYDITPIQSLIITTQNTEPICIKRVEISVTNNAIMHIDQIYNEAQCVSFPGFIGCNVMTLDFRNDKSTQKTQLPCNITETSFTDTNANIPDTTEYVLTVQVSEGTTDFIFYQMEGHNGKRTECFNTAGFKLPEGRSEHRYGYMKNVGNPKKLYLMHDRNDDICIESIWVFNARTNDTVSHIELMCSHFLYDAKQKGRCNVITINFETNITMNNVYKNCPFEDICEFGLYEDPYGSNGLSAGQIFVIVFVILIILFIILSLMFGYKCLWCNCVYCMLYKCWDPFVDKFWNPKYETKCFHCSNTTAMQHNLCCYCFGCDYCNPFSIYRKRMDAKKDRNSGIGDDTHDIEEADRFNLTAEHDKDMYDMNSIDNIDLGDNVKIAGNGTHTKKDDDGIGEISVDFDDSDSAELQLKGNKNNYSHLNDVEDAPINMSMYDDNDDINTAVVDHYDNPTLR